MHNILVVDDYLSDIDKVRNKFAGVDRYTIFHTHSYQGVVEYLNEHPIHLIILDQFFTNTDTVTDYLGKENDQIVVLERDPHPREENEQGFLILKKLRSDDVQIPVLMLSDKEQNWYKTYQQQDALHLLDKDDMFRHNSDFLLRLVDRIVQQPQSFLGDSLSINGILADVHLKTILFEQKDKWRDQWQNIVNDFIHILTERGITEATSRHYFDYRSLLMAKKKRRFLNAQEIEEILQKQFVDIKFVCEYHSYYLFKKQEGNQRKAIFVLKDNYCYDKKSIEKLKENGIGCFKIPLNMENDLQQNQQSQPPSANLQACFTSRGYRLRSIKINQIDNGWHLDDYYREDRDPRRYIIRNFGEHLCVTPNHITIVEPKQFGYISLNENHPFSINDIIAYFETSWFFGNADQPMDYYDYCQKYFKQDHYRDLKRNLDFLSIHAGVPCIIPDNVMFFQRQRRMEVRYINFSLEKLLRREKNRDLLPEYFSKTPNRLFWNNQRLSYVHNLHLLYFWLKDRWPERNLNAAYFNTLFQNAPVIDQFNSFYRKKAKEMVFTYSAFAIGEYKIDSFVKLENCRLSIDQVEEPLIIRNITFERNVHLQNIESDELQFINCKFAEKLIIEKSLLPKLHFENCEFKEFIFRDLLETNQVDFINCKFSKGTFAQLPQAEISLQCCTFYSQNLSNMLIFKGEEFSSIKCDESMISNLNIQNTIVREKLHLSQPRAPLTTNFDKTEFYGEVNITLDSESKFEIKIDRGRYLKDITIKGQGDHCRLILEDANIEENLIIEVHTLVYLYLSKNLFHKKLQLPVERIIEGVIDNCELRGGMENKMLAADPEVSFTMRANECYRAVSLREIKNFKKLELEGNIFYFPLEVKECAIEEFSGPSIYREIADFAKTTFTRFCLSPENKGKAVFSSEACFQECYFESSDFQRSIFEKGLNCYLARFMEPPHIQKIQAQSVRLEHSHFSTNNQGVAVDFSGSNIRQLDLSNVVFGEGSYPLLGDASIENSRMETTLIDDLLKVRYKSFKQKSDKELEMLLPELKHLHQSLIDINDFEKADKYYVKLCDLERALKRKGWLAYNAGKWTCSFGTSWWRPLASIGIVSILVFLYLWGMVKLPMENVYYMIDIVCGSKPDLDIDASLVTWNVWVAVATGAILNLVFINLFMVTLARKWIR